MGLDVIKPDLHTNIKGADQTVHLRSLISTFVIHSLHTGFIQSSVKFKGFSRTS